MPYAHRLGWLVASSNPRILAMFRYAIALSTALAAFTLIDVSSAQAQYGLSYGAGYGRQPNCVRQSAYVPVNPYARTSAYAPYSYRQSYYAPGIAVARTSYYSPGIRTGYYATGVRTSAYAPTAVYPYGGYGNLGYPGIRPVARTAPRVQLRVGF